MYLLHELPSSLPILGAPSYLALFTTYRPPLSAIKQRKKVLPGILGKLNFIRFSRFLNRFKIIRKRGIPKGTWILSRKKSLLHEHLCLFLVCLKPIYVCDYKKKIIQHTHNLVHAVKSGLRVLLGSQRSKKRQKCGSSGFRSRYLIHAKDTCYQVHQRPMMGKEREQEGVEIDRRQDRGRMEGEAYRESKITTPLSKEVCRLIPPRSTLTRN